MNFQPFGGRCDEWRGYSLYEVRGDGGRNSLRKGSWAKIGRADRLHENLSSLISLELTFLSRRLHSTKTDTLRHKWFSTNSLAYRKHPDFTAITTLPEFQFVVKFDLHFLESSFLRPATFPVWFLLVYGIWFQSNTWNLLQTHKVTRDVRISTA